MYKNAKNKRKILYNKVLKHFFMTNLLFEEKN